MPSGDGDLLRGLASALVDDSNAGNSAGFPGNNNPGGRTRCSPRDVLLANEAKVAEL